MSPSRTPLYQRHLELGGRMVEFGGWSMPVQYQGIVAEHLACRQAMGLFDVSHMGEFLVSGPGAVPFLDGALTNRVADLPVGRCRYSLMCRADGGIVDDLLVYRLADQELLLVVNAANIAGDLAWLRDQPAAGVELVDRSPELALLALQGPRSRDLLASLVAPEDADRLAAMKYYHFGRFRLPGGEALISRTGYTGGLGYELMVPAGQAVALWDTLLAAGAGAGLVPVGLGARDTLRLEAGLCLHGHDISPERNPIEAGLERFVKLDKEFRGRDVLARLAAEGTPEKLIGLLATGPGVMREGCAVEVGGKPAGCLTSGTFSPLLKRSIGLGYVRREVATAETEAVVQVRGKPLPCRLVHPPFHKPG